MTILKADGTPRYQATTKGERPPLPNGGKCQKCNSGMLYHDYDPRHAHNGYTCAMCGTEQVLANGAKSTILPKPEYVRALAVVA